SRQRLLRVSHQFSQLCAQAVHADQCLEHALSFLQSIVKRSSYIALLDEQPTALKRMVAVFDKSQWLSQQLINYPLLLDELLDARVMDQRFDTDQLSQQIHASLSSHADDIESALLALNEFKISYTFKIGYHFLFQHLPAHKASHLLSLLAEQMLVHCTKIASDELAKQHGHIADSSFAVIGYGSLGASCLAFNSDLDLVFLNQTQTLQQSDGKRPLDVARFFLRQAQKLISLLGLSTTSGFLYEVDIRLRPDGAKGLLVSSIDSYEQYQLQRAWVWELQALVRARAVAGNEDLQQRFEVLRQQLLCVERDHAVLQKEIIAMRLRMRTELDRSDEQHFDIKHGLGGLTDIEFFLQAQMLIHSPLHPELTQKRESLAIITCLCSLGLLSELHADGLAKAYEHLLMLGLTCHLNNKRRVVERTNDLASITARVSEILQAHDFNLSA
nr:hypothetical protein [Arenimonas sp.]